jgi:[ribosomal protein S5]-alanine N-acetyltransferase
MNPAYFETDRLLIRPFVEHDLQMIHRILDQTFGDGTNIDNASALQERRSWLEWSILSQEWLPKMDQTPYGDRAVVLKTTDQVIGSVGYVPLRDVYWQIPELGIASRGYTTPEVGLFWVIDPAHQQQGYATEAAQALIDHAFRHWRLARILATTDDSNIASQAVMRKLGMKLTRNPLPEPQWLQVVGVLDNTG